MSIRPESRAKFERQGVLLTKLNLEMGNMDGPEQQETVSWIAEQERDPADERRKSALGRATHSRRTAAALFRSGRPGLAIQVEVAANAGPRGRVSSRI